MIIYLDFIPSFTYPGVEWGCVCTLRKCTPIEYWDRCEHWLVDQGLELARKRLPMLTVFKVYVRKVRGILRESKPKSLTVVMPDVFGSLRSTVANAEDFLGLWRQYGPRDDRIRYALVLHQPHLYLEGSEVVDPALYDVLAIPCRYMTLDRPIQCGSSPLYARVCAKIVRDVVEEVNNPIHLLGPGRRVLRQLKEVNTLERIHSIDGLGYRLSSGIKVRVKRSTWERGGYMIPGDLQSIREAYLKEWTRGIF